MKKRVLVAYASALGSTVDVAATIGETFGANGVLVDVKPIKENPQVDGYQAVVLGSAIQGAKWLPEAVDFVKANQLALSCVPVALFCVHFPIMGSDKMSEEKRLAYMDEVRSLLQPVDEGYFRGRADRRTYAIFFSGLPAWLCRFIPPIDNRNWEKIRAWAGTVRPLLFQ